MLAIRLGRVLAPLAALLAGSGCAHTASAVPRDDDARIAALEAELATLRRELSPAAPLAAPVVVSQAGADEGSGPLVLDGTTELVLPTDASLVESDGDAGPAVREGEGGRVVLRLHEQRPVDVPVVSERLPVASMPTLPPVPAGATPAPAAAPNLPPAGATTAAAAGAPVPAVLPTTNAPAASVPTAAAPAEELRGYREALDHLTARRFEQAVAGFSGFLRDQPGSARADDALYFRATAHYALRRYRDALIDYERVVRIAPRGDRAADALYHAALCQRRLGDQPRADATMRRVIDEYPDTGAARLAQREDRT